MHSGGTDFPAAFAIYGITYIDDLDGQYLGFAGQETAPIARSAVLRESKHRRPWEGRYVRYAAGLGHPKMRLNPRGDG